MPERKLLTAPDQQDSCTKRDKFEDSVESLAQLLVGDPDTWQAFHIKYYGLVITVPLRRTGDTQVADDVVQSTYLRLFEKGWGINHPDKISSWLVTTAWRETRDLLLLDDQVHGRHGRLKSNGNGIDRVAMLQIFQSDGAPVEKMVERSEDSSELDDALKKLADVDRSLIELLFLDPRCLSYVEIAEELNIPFQSIGKRRKRIFLELRGIIIKDELGFQEQHGGLEEVEDEANAVGKNGHLLTQEVADKGREGELKRKQKTESVRNALKRLPPEKQMILCMLSDDSSDDSYKKVSERLGIPIESVGAMHRESLRDLNEIMGNGSEIIDAVQGGETLIDEANEGGKNEHLPTLEKVRQELELNEERSRNYMLELSGRDQEILYLRYYDLSKSKYRQIAEKLDIPIGSVGGRVRAALKSLHKIYKAHNARDFREEQNGDIGEVEKGGSLSSTNGHILLREKALQETGEVSKRRRKEENVRVAMQQPGRIKEVVLCRLYSGGSSVASLEEVSEELGLPKELVIEIHEKAMEKLNNIVNNEHGKGSGVVEEGVSERTSV